MIDSGRNDISGKHGIGQQQQRETVRPARYCNPQPPLARPKRGKIGGKPLLLPGRHFLNLAGLLIVIWFGRAFLNAHSIEDGMLPLLVMTVIALLFGVHMVMAIGGADMPVVVSMLNSYSGWTAAAAGFMLSNDLLIVTGALVGSSGAILSTIMCRAMNRSIWSVVFGGFGAAEGAAPAPGGPQGEYNIIDVDDPHTGYCCSTGGVCR